LTKNEEKTENRAVEARLSGIEHGGCHRSIGETCLGRCKLGLKGWEVEIDQCTRVEGFGPKTKNRAAGARFSRTNRRGRLDWVEGTYLWQGKPELRGWEVGIGRRARVGGFGPKCEKRATGARFSRTNRGGPLK
jgi:hypothetical protein